MTAALSPSLLPFSRTHNPKSPAHLGSRYNPAGTFLPEPGNTIVCHLHPGSATEAALIDARSHYLAMPEASHLAFTPISSLHMTLFQGIIEGRRALPYWPGDVPLDTSIPEMTRIFTERLKALRPAPAFNVTVTEALPTGLHLEGATHADRAAIAEWRNRFADLLGYRHPDHDIYVLHITFAYVIERFDAAALAAWQRMLDEVAADIRSRAPVLHLNPPAFCSFADMNHFEELLVFQPG